MEQNANLELDRRIVYPDILRVLAVFAIMATHICAYFFYNDPVSSLGWQIANIYDSLTRWAVPVFIMISGMFFLNPQKEVSIQKLYRKYIFRIVVALFFWGIVYQSANVIKRVLLEKANSNMAIMEALKEFILGPTWYHLWFLYLIIGLYMFVPIFRIFTKNATEKHYRYLLILFLSCGCALPLLQEFLFFADKSFRLYFSLKEFLGYSCYFILGYYFSRFYLPPKMRYIVYISAACSVIFQIIGTSLISYKYNRGIEVLYTNFTPNVAIQAIAIFLLVKEICSKIKLSDRKIQLIGLLGKYSFGMYLVHDFFNGIFYRIGFYAIGIPQIFDIPIRTIMTFLSSFLVICILSRIPVIKKYCM